uniref:Uncharacterized protein n=1 Tax=Opuntia streptacantha TaxID=393608 RepID=A0A7C9CHH4_OPUST
MLRVAGSVALKRGKFPNRAFKAFKYSSFTVPVAHKSFSIAAVIALTVSLEAYSWIVLLENSSLINIAACTEVSGSLEPIRSSITWTPPASATALLFDRLYITRFCKAQIATTFISSVGWSSSKLTKARQAETASAVRARVSFWKRSPKASVASNLAC